MNMELLPELKHKEYTAGGSRDRLLGRNEQTLFKCAGIVRKANLQVQIKVAREEKGDKESFFMCTSSRKTEIVEQWEWALLSGAGNPLTRDMEKTQVLYVLFFPQFSLAILPPGPPAPQAL